MLAPVFTHHVPRTTYHVPRTTYHAPASPTRHQALQIPPHKTFHVVFLEGRIRSRTVGARIHAFLLAFADQPVLFGGQPPERQDGGQVVVASFDRPFVHQP